MTPTYPLLDRINARRKVGRIGPVSPVPIKDRMSPFARKMAERSLAPKALFIDGSWTPSDDGSAA